MELLEKLNDESGQNTVYLAHDNFTIEKQGNTLMIGNTMYVFPFDKDKKYRMTVLINPIE